MIKEVDPSDWPRCDKCDMPVEDFQVTDKGNSLEFVARCHGDQELVVVPDEFWNDEVGAIVEIGPAFRQDENYEEQDPTEVDMGFYS